MRVTTFLLMTLISFFSASETFAVSHLLNYDCITSDSNKNCSSGEQLIITELNDLGSSLVQLNFYNDGDTNSVITSIYLEDTENLLSFSELIDSENGGHSGVSFSTSNNPKNLPAGNKPDVDFDATSGLSFTANPAGPKNGINSGEWLGIIFQLESGQNIDSLLSAFNEGDIRLGVHVTAGKGISGSFASTTLTQVPLPASIIFFATAILVLLSFKRNNQMSKGNIAAV